MTATVPTNRLVTPDDPRYPALRSTYTTVGAPSAIVLARDADDVAAALERARTDGVPVSVRSGGHGLSGRSTGDGVVVDLSTMNRVRLIDPDRNLVRVEAGARWSDVAAALAPHGLAISAGDHGNVGVGGLATAGGIGWLVRDRGLTIDHVQAADLVLADGTPARAEPGDDLLWALRGAGGGVGVVLAFEIEATPTGDVGVAQLVYDADVLSDWASAMATAPRVLTTSGTLTRELSYVVTAVVASADEDTVRAALEPLLALGPRHVLAHLVPYTALVPREHLHPNVGQSPVTTSSALFPRLTPAAARSLKDAALGGALVQIRSLGGAVDDVPQDATAYAHRDHQVLATGTLFGRDRGEFGALWQPVLAHATGAYVNFESATTPDVFRRAYPGRTGDRVRELWRRYDPDAVLRPVSTD